jgi:hypothetical protein
MRSFGETGRGGSRGTWFAVLAYAFPRSKDTPSTLGVAKPDSRTEIVATDALADLVQWANALDHCEEPGKVFAEMVAVCRPGGLVRIISFENEGQMRVSSEGGSLHHAYAEGSHDLA